MGMEKVVSLAFLTLTLFVIVGVQAQSAVCPNLITLTETSGVITSPFYPSNYPSYAKCSWKITASKGKRVKLVIEDLFIEWYATVCPWDYLQIQNGSLSGDGVPYGQMCGRFVRNVTLFSFRETLTMLFVTDSSGNYRGFKVTYSQVNFANITDICTSGEFLNSSSGFFSSPHFPSNYPQHSRCIWNIKVPSGYIIKVSFSHFELDPYWNDRVIITNVASVDGNMPFQLGGQSVPSSVYSVGNSIQVMFTSLTSQYSGFNATYTAITYESVCPGLLTLNETSGVISSPFYPSNSPHLAKCSWKITASKGKRVKLVIEDMSINWYGTNCPWDYLQIQNGSLSGDGVPYGRMCGRVIRNVTLFSFRENLNVLFVTDPSVTYRGFKATYSQVNFTNITDICTSGEFLTGSSGFFSSPNFPNKYPQHSRCIWNITVPSGYIIKVSFSHFELDPYWNDRVIITNVASVDGNMPFQLVGQSVSSPVFSVGNFIQVIFTSLTNQYSGFNATYTAITYESVCPGLLTLNETSGVITSPFYPSNYPHLAKCSWKITASKGKRIKLVIENMDIERHKRCLWDYLEIQNVSLSGDGVPYGRMCGRLIRNITLFSFREILNVLFVTDLSMTYRGFKATYSQVNFTNIVETPNTSGNVATPSLSSTEVSLRTTDYPPLPLISVTATGRYVPKTSDLHNTTSTPASASSSDVITPSLTPTEMPVEEKFKARIALGENYLSGYSNLSSTESRAFIRNFTSKVEFIFRLRLSNFIRVEITGLLNGSVVVNFNIVVDKSSNATESNIITALRDGNSTGALGYQLIGDITVKEVQESSTAMTPSTSATETESETTTKKTIQPTTESETTTELTIQPTTHRIITEEVTITEEDDVILNCTLEHFDGRHVWSREDGTPVLTTTRVLTEDTQLEIKQASIADTGVFVCKNGQFITHRFIVLVEVLVKVQMIVKVLNYEYTPELKNKSSEIYKATERNFTSEMDKVYNNTPGYVRTEVLNFTKGSVNVDFRVIITITASDPKNATTIPDTKAETAHRVVVEAKDGFVKQLKVDPNVEVFSPPLEPKDVEIFGIKSDELSVRWKPPADSDAFKVLKYYVQYKEFTAGVYINVSFPATQGKNTYSYRIQDLEAETTYLVRAGAGNKYGTNFNEAEGHKTDPAPFATWIIVLIVLAILLVLGIIVGLIVCKRRRSEQRRRALEEEEDNRFGGLIGDVRMNPVSHYEDKNVKGLKYSYTNESFRPSEVNWKEIPYEKLTLMNELGSGAFGVVYKGELKRENGDVTPCAVKSLKASATSEEIRDLYNELEIMTNVGYHPNLVNLLGACTQDGHLLVVLEIAENGSLLEFLKKSRETNQNYENINSGGLTEEMKLKIATDVAKGMSHLANCRCIHRDLAARNVLLGENYVAKVSDYGMARDVYEQLMYKKETQGKLPVKWMAIESLETYIFTVESDVWSYGVFLWEIESAGLKPYAGMNTTELITELKKGYRLEKPAGCSDAMYQIMRDCWSPNPKARPTFDELVARLENMAVTS